MPKRLKHICSRSNSTSKELWVTNTSTTREYKRLNKRGTHVRAMFDTDVQRNKTSRIKHENKRNVLSCLIECLMRVPNRALHSLHPDQTSGEMPIVLRTFTYSSRNFLGLSYAYCSLLFIDAQEARISLVAMYARQCSLVCSRRSIQTIDTACYCFLISLLKSHICAQYL